MKKSEWMEKGNDPEDVCPKCFKRDLLFWERTAYPGGFCLAVECDTCGWEGKQHYHLGFNGFTDKDGGFVMFTPPLMII